MAHKTLNSAAREVRYRVLYDWFTLGLADDGIEKYLLFMDEFSGFSWVYLYPVNDVNLVRHFESFFTIIQNQYGIRFKFLRVDKEAYISIGQLITLLNLLGVGYEEVPTATLA